MYGSTCTLNGKRRNHVNNNYCLAPEREVTLSLESTRSDASKCHQRRENDKADHLTHSTYCARPSTCQFNSIYHGACANGSMLHGNLAAMPWHLQLKRSRDCLRMPQHVNHINITSFGTVPVAWRILPNQADTIK